MRYGNWLPTRSQAGRSMSVAAFAQNAVTSERNRVVANAAPARKALLTGKVDLSRATRP
jgi:hypothetical protein